MSVAFNPKANKLVREKYKKKLDMFVAQCKLIDFLNTNMELGYKEPVERPFEFDQKMSAFIQLKKCGLSVHN